MRFTPEKIAFAIPEHITVAAEGIPRTPIDFDLTDGTMDPKIAKVVAGCVAELEGHSSNNGSASRHDAARAAVMTVVRFSERGLGGGIEGLGILHKAFVAAIGDDRANAGDEFADLVTGAIALVASTESTIASADEMAAWQTHVDSQNDESITASENVDDDPLASWDPVDLGPALRGEKEKIEPTILRRTDGVALFYPRRINYLHGPDTSGKTWLALVAAKQEILAGRAVVWLDFEDGDEDTVIERLILLGVPTERIAALFHYINPDIGAGVLAVARVVALIERTGATLVVVDSVGEAFSLESINEDKDAEVGPWIRRVLRTLADAGPAVLPIDHGTKSSDNTLHPSGSKRKRAAISGMGVLVEASPPPAKGVTGWLRVTCTKDRHGNFRRGDLVANVKVETEPDDGLAITVYPPPPPRTLEQSKATDVVGAARAAVSVLRKHQPDGVTKRELEEQMATKKAAAVKRAGIDAAIRVGAIEAVSGGHGKATTHKFVRELSDDDLAGIRGDQ